MAVSTLVDRAVSTAGSLDQAIKDAHAAVLRLEKTRNDATSAGDLRAADTADGQLSTASEVWFQLTAEQHRRRMASQGSRPVSHNAV